ncbi:MAG TPA: HD domain-containing phosphohydrolase [Actinomycetota bacterium]|nr:HD domain-containing phosphohydrolase [Actinomycetota bacterium]
MATVAGTQRRGVDSGVQLAEVVASIALAADLGLGQPLEHVLRTCIVATRFADHLGLSQEDRDATYWVALFTTAGCTGVSFELAAVFGDDIEFRKAVTDISPSPFDIMRFIIGRAGSGRGALTRARIKADLLFTRMSAVERSFLAHCAVSAQLTNRLGLGELVETCLYQTFAQYNGKGLPRNLGGDELLVPIQISNMALQALALCRDKSLDAALDFVGKCAGKIFDPKLVAEFSANSDELLASTDEDSTWNAVVGAQPPGRGPLTEDELDDALALIGDYADLKSPWFTGHSRGVASLAVAAARTAGLPASDVKTLERAAWVHDIGRNGVPNNIWDKPGPLTDLEMEKVRLHSYYTDRVLHNAGKLALLASVASAAHERADGTGYPRRIAGPTIPLLGRFLEAADSYHAMIEDRPHRAALSRDEAAKELRRGAREGSYDGAAVDAVLSAAGHQVRRKPSTPAGLTPREVEVLVLAARGGTTRAVAHALGIAPKTAGNHIERIYAKIGVNSRAEAAMFAMQSGLLPDWETTET